MLAEQQRREGSAEWELEMDKTVDQEFYSGFVKTITEVRKEWSKGRPHWYLVSLISRFNVALPLRQRIFATHANSQRFALLFILTAFSLPELPLRRPVSSRLRCRNRSHRVRD